MEELEAKVDALAARLGAAGPAGRGGPGGGGGGGEPAPHALVARVVGRRVSAHRRGELGEEGGARRVALRERGREGVQPRVQREQELERLWLGSGSGLGFGLGFGLRLGLLEELERLRAARGWGGRAAGVPEQRVEQRGEVGGRDARWRAHHRAERLKATCDGRRRALDGRAAREAEEDAPGVRAADLHRRARLQKQQRAGAHLLSEGLALR